MITVMLRPRRAGAEASGYGWCHTSRRRAPVQRARPLRERWRGLRQFALPVGSATVRERGRNLGAFRGLFLLERCAWSPVVSQGP
jgi:hypothetical protein